MTKRSVSIILALLLVFSVVHAASAGKDWGNGPRTQYNVLGEDPVNNLNLTDQQITKLRDIQKKNHQETRELKIKLYDTVFELKQLKLQKNPDKSQIEAKSKEIKELKDKLSDNRQRNRTECQSILTDEQKAKLPKDSGPCGFGPGGGKGGPCQ